MRHSIKIRRKIAKDTVFPIISINNIQRDASSCLWSIIHKEKSTIEKYLHAANFYGSSRRTIPFRMNCSKTWVNVEFLPIKNSMVITQIDNRRSQQAEPIRVATNRRSLERTCVDLAPKKPWSVKSKNEPNWLVYVTRASASATGKFLFLLHDASLHDSTPRVAMISRDWLDKGGSSH